MVLSINTSQFTNISSPLVGEGRGEGEESEVKLTPSYSFDHALWNRLTQAGSRFVHGDAAVIAGSVITGLFFATSARALIPASIAGGLATMGVGVLANSLGGVIGGEIVLSLLHYVEPKLFTSTWQLYDSQTEESLDQFHELIMVYGEQWMASAFMSFVLGSAAGMYGAKAARWAGSSNQLAAFAGKASQRIANAFESTRGSFANRTWFESFQEFAEHWAEVLGGKKFSYAVSVLTGGGRSREGTVNREQGQKTGSRKQEAGIPPPLRGGGQGEGDGEITHFDLEVAGVINALRDKHRIDLTGAESRNFIGGPIVIAVPKSMSFPPRGTEGTVQSGNPENGSRIKSGMTKPGSPLTIRGDDKAPTILQINNRDVYLVTENSPIWDQLVREYGERNGHWTDPAENADPEYQAFAHRSVGAASNPDPTTGLSEHSPYGPLTIHRGTTDTIPDHLVVPLDVEITQEVMLERLRRLEGPMALHLNLGHQTTRVVSVLLHGNEPSSWYAFLALLRKIKSGEFSLVTNVVFLVHNVKAAQADNGFEHRYLPDQGQRDANRIWTDQEEDPYAREVMRLLAEIHAKAPVKATADLHNNTGRNPVYGIFATNEQGEPHPGSLKLAWALSDKVILSGLHHGILTTYTERFGPSVAIECGKAGDSQANKVALNKLEAFLTLDLADLSRTSPKPVYRLGGVVGLKEGVEVRLAETESAPSSGAAFVLFINPEVDVYNLSEMPSDSWIGNWNGETLPFVLEIDGRDVTNEFFELKEGKIFTRRNFTPAMATANIRNINLGRGMFYLLEPVASPATNSNPGKEDRRDAPLPLLQLNVGHLLLDPRYPVGVLLDYNGLFLTVEEALNVLQKLQDSPHVEYICLFGLGWVENVFDKKEELTFEALQHHFPKLRNLSSHKCTHSNFAAAADITAALYRERIDPNRNTLVLFDDDAPIWHRHLRAGKEDDPGIQCVHVRYCRVNYGRRPSTPSSIKQDVEALLRRLEQIGSSKPSAVSPARGKAGDTPDGMGWYADVTSEWNESYPWPPSQHPDIVAEWDRRRALGLRAKQGKTGNVPNAAKDSFTIRRLIDSLKKNGGKRRATARNLGVSRERVERAVKNAPPNSRLAEFKDKHGGHPKLDDLELATLLNEYDGNRSKVAKKIGVSLQAVSDRINRATRGNPLYRFRDKRGKPESKVIGDHDLALALHRNGGNQNKTAKAVGLTSATVSRRISGAPKKSVLAVFQDESKKNKGGAPRRVTDEEIARAIEVKGGSVSAAAAHLLITPGAIWRRIRLASPDSLLYQLASPDSK